jgi:predicted Holliday junction resolvase-like endonuclease
LAVVVGVGFAVGVAITYALMRKAATSTAEARFEAWRATGIGKVRRAAVDGARAGAKETVGRAVALDLGTIPFVAADARFLGHPVHYLVFDGHTEVKDRAASSLREVVFLTLAPAGSPPSPFSELVRECVAGGRIAWMTLRV